MARKNSPWRGASGDRLGLELVRLVPSFIAQIQPRRKRATGEILIRCLDIRTMAAKHGLVRIPNKRLSIALIAAGGKHHFCGMESSSYVFEGFWQIPLLVDSVSEKVAQYINSQKEPV